MYKNKKQGSPIQNKRSTSPSLRVLFIHNSVPEYRIKFWELLGERLDIQLLITNKDLDEKIYGLEKNTGNLKIEYIKFYKLFENSIYKTSNYDVVILPPADTLKEFLIGLLYSIRCKFNGIKIIYWTEHWEANRKDCSLKRYLYNISERIMIYILASLADKCIASGKCASKFYSDINIKKEKVNIVIDSSTSNISKNDIDFFRDYNIPSDSKVILYFGRLVERKGIIFLLEAFSCIPKNEDYWLMVCGDGPMLNKCKEIVLNNHLDKVIFTGKIQPNLRRKFYERANVFVLPSWPRQGSVEAWGLTINEALECGTPVIATDAVGAAYDLLDGYDGCMIKHSSVNELKEAIMKYSNKDKYKKHCFEISKLTNVESMAANFEKVIQDAVNQS